MKPYFLSVLLIMISPMVYAQYNPAKTTVMITFDRAVSLQNDAKKILRNYKNQNDLYLQLKNVIKAYGVKDKRYSNPLKTSMILATDAELLYIIGHEILLEELQQYTDLSEKELAIYYIFDYREYERDIITGTIKSSVLRLDQKKYNPLIKDYVKKHGNKFTEVREVIGKYYLTLNEDVVMEPAIEFARRNPISKNVCLAIDKGYLTALKTEELLKCWSKTHVLENTIRQLYYQEKFMKKTDKRFQEILQTWLYLNKHATLDTPLKEHYFGFGKELLDEERFYNKYFTTVSNEIKDLFSRYGLDLAENVEVKNLDNDCWRLEAPAMQTFKLKIKSEWVEVYRTKTSEN